MITQQEAIAIARREVEDALQGADTPVEAELKDGQYVVEFKYAWPPGTRGPSFVRITVDASSGEVLERLSDAD